MLLRHEKLPSVLLVFQQFLVFFRQHSSKFHLFRVPQIVDWDYCVFILLHKISLTEESREALSFQLLNLKIACNQVEVLQSKCCFDLCFNLIFEFFWGHNFSFIFSFFNGDIFVFLQIIWETDLKFYFQFAVLLWICHKFEKNAILQLIQFFTRLTKLVEFLIQRVQNHNSTKTFQNPSAVSRVGILESLRSVD